MSLLVGHDAQNVPFAVRTYPDRISLRTELGDSDVGVDVPPYIRHSGANLVSSSSHRLRELMRQTTDKAVRHLPCAAADNVQRQPRSNTSSQIRVTSNQKGVRG